MCLTFPVITWTLNANIFTINLMILTYDLNRFILEDKIITFAGKVVRSKVIIFTAKLEGRRLE